ncbi:MAG: hypothetical protein ACI9G1_005721, partial [Pirellulaceae bacterium]
DNDDNGDNDDNDDNDDKPVSCIDHRNAIFTTVAIRLDRNYGFSSSIWHNDSSKNRTAECALPSYILTDVPKKLN